MCKKYVSGVQSQGLGNPPGAYWTSSNLSEKKALKMFCYVWPVQIRTKTSVSRGVQEKTSAAAFFV